MSIADNYNVNYKDIEYKIYKTSDDAKKVKIELKRLSDFFIRNREAFIKFGYDYLEILNLYSLYLSDMQTNLLDEIMNRIVDIEEKCEIKVGLVSKLKDNNDDLVLRR